jgi:flagellar hook protein FlgE
LDEASGSISTEGIVSFVSNAGIANALGVSLSSFSLTPDGEDTPVPVSLPFTETQVAHGEGSITDFIVFDSLGSSVTVRVSTVLEDKADTFTRYRWFATSEDNEPTDPSVDTFVGTGTIVFDSNGNIQSGGIGEINILRNQSASASPLAVNLDFGQVSGLALTNSQNENVSSMSMTRQDGFPPGTLSSFIITESGLIRGIFTNGAERPLGQIRMARFTNNGGLQQVGENMFATGVNSGEPINGNPGDSGIGTLTAGALELSNTDIGQNLIELILASTQYRGGARVITTAQQLLDELLTLRR